MSYLSDGHTVKAITLHAPWGTLLVTRQPGVDLLCSTCGASASLPLGMSCADHRPAVVPRPMVKQWETRSWPCPPSIIGQRVVFHQAKQRPSDEHVGDWQAIEVHGRDYRLRHLPSDAERSVEERVLDMVFPEDSSWLPVPLGCIVGSGIITESLPITDRRAMPDHGPQVSHNPASGVLYQRGSASGDALTHISDQLPYGDWTPGRYAWRITEAAPTTERCPWCWGRGDTDPYMHSTCPVCDGAGHCAPHPATGQQGWWNWTPDRSTP